jgi:hypothetical protein
MSLPPALSDEALARLPGAPPPSAPTADATSGHRGGWRRIAGRAKALARRIVGRAVRPELALLEADVAELQRAQHAIEVLQRRVGELEVARAAEPARASTAQALADLAQRVEALERRAASATGEGERPD